MMSIKHVLASVALGVALIAAPATIDASVTTPTSKTHAAKAHVTKKHPTKLHSKHAPKHAFHSKAHAKTALSHKGAKAKTLTSHSGWKHHPSL